MTTAIGIETNDGALIGADTQVTDGTGRILETRKIVQNGQFIVSGAGDCLPLDILQFIWKPPIVTAKDKKDLFAFMVAQVSPSIREVLERNKYDKNASGNDGFDALIAIAGHIFSIGDDYSIATPRNGVLAVGTGGAYALGALRHGATIQRALEIADENDANTSAPFQFAEQKK